MCAKKTLAGYKVKRPRVLFAVCVRSKLHKDILSANCPSKKPKTRDKVALFPDSASAKRAGFRPCRRCEPDEFSQATAQVRTIQKLCEFITENWNERLTLERLSKESGFSPFHLQRTFRKVTGVTPREYIEAVRMAS